MACVKAEPQVVQSDDESEISLISNSQDSQSSEKHKVSQVAFMAIIKSHPIIYDETHPDYKKRIPNRNAWEDVAEQAEQNVTAAKARFGYIKRKANENTQKYVDLMRILQDNGQKKKKRLHSPDPVPKGILKIKHEQSSVRGLVKNVHFVDDNNNKTMTDAEFLNVISSKLDILSLKNREELKMYTLSKITDFFTTLGC